MKRSKLFLMQRSRAYCCYGYLPSEREFDKIYLANVTDENIKLICLLEVATCTLWANVWNLASKM